MHPTCFCLEKIGDKSRLYVTEIMTTAAALATFARPTPIKVTEFEGSKDRGAIWISTKDLPPLQTVGEVLNYLASNDNLNLIDFGATIGGGINLSTHDDCEASFTVSTQEQAVEIMRAVTEPALLPTVLAATIANPGKYISIPDGSVRIFSTFKDWVAANQRPDA